MRRGSRSGTRRGERDPPYGSIQRAANLGSVQFHCTAVKERKNRKDKDTDPGSAASTIAASRAGGFFAQNPVPLRKARVSNPACSLQRDEVSRG